MPKYDCYLTYTETRVITLEADDEEQAKELAYERMDDAEPTGDDDTTVEVEEVIE